MFDGNLLESHLGKVDSDLFSANARVAFFDEEDATKKAIELLEEHLRNYKKKEEEEQIKPTRRSLQWVVRGLPFCAR